MAAQPTNVILRWTLLAETRRLDEWTTVALPPEGAEPGFEFEHGGQRWRVTRAGLAGEMGFDQAIATAAALECAPVYAFALDDPLPEPATAP